MIRKNIEAIVYSLFVPEIRTQSLPNETCSPTDYIRLNPTKSLVDAYLCTDGNRQKPDWNIIKRPVCRPHRYTSRLKSIMWIISRTEILE